MDAKITKSRLSNMLSYDWLKILAVSVVVVFVWWTVLTLLGADPTVAQSIHFIYYNDIYLGENYDTYSEKFIDSEDYDGVFSYEILETNYVEMSSSDTYGNYAFAAKLAAGERSMIFASTQVDEDAEEEGDTYISELVNGYYSILEEIPSYLEAAREYLEPFFGGDIENGSIDSAYLEAQFRERNADDKRYKTEEQIQQGLSDEEDRIVQTRDSLLNILAAEEEGIISFTSTYIRETETEGVYSILLGTSRLQGIKELMYVRDENGTASASGINVCFFLMNKEEEMYMRFEKLNYIDYLITTYTDTL